MSKNSGSQARRDSKARMIRSICSGVMRRPMGTSIAVRGRHARLGVSGHGFSGWPALSCAFTASSTNLRAP